MGKFQRVDVLIICGLNLAYLIIAIPCGVFLRESCESLDDRWREAATVGMVDLVYNQVEQRLLLVNSLLSQNTSIVSSEFSITNTAVDVESIFSFSAAGGVFVHFYKLLPPSSNKYLRCLLLDSTSRVIETNSDFSISESQKTHHKTINSAMSIFHISCSDDFKNSEEMSSIQAIVVVWILIPLLSVIVVVGFMVRVYITNQISKAEKYLVEKSNVRDWELNTSVADFSSLFSTISYAVSVMNEYASFLPSVTVSKSEAAQQNQDMLTCSREDTGLGLSKKNSRITFDRNSSISIISSRRGTLDLDYVRDLTDVGTLAKVTAQILCIKFEFSQQLLDGLQQLGNAMLPSVLPVMNDILEIIASHIAKTNGTVIGATGELLYAYWPTPHDTEIINNCSSGMLEALKRNSDDHVVNNYTPIHASGGVALGPSLFGATGVQGLKTYSVIGSVTQGAYLGACLAQQCKLLLTFTKSTILEHRMEEYLPIEVIHCANEEIAYYRSIGSDDTDESITSFRSAFSHYLNGYYGDACDELDHYRMILQEIHQEVAKEQHINLREEPIDLIAMRLQDNLKKLKEFTVANGTPLGELVPANIQVIYPRVLTQECQGGSDNVSDDGSNLSMSTSLSTRHIVQKLKLAKREISMRKSMHRRLSKAISFSTSDSKNTGSGANPLSMETTCDLTDTKTPIITIEQRTADERRSKAMRLLHTWNSLSLLLLIYNSFWVPVRWGFNYRAVHPALTSINFFLDVGIYWVKIYLTLTTPYEEGANIIDDLGKIRHHYVRNGLLLDIVACFPVELLALAWETPHEAMSNPLYRTNRILNISHLPQYFQSFFINRANHSILVKIAKFLICLFFMVHFIACAMAYGLLQENGYQTPFFPHEDFPDYPGDRKYALLVDWTVRALFGYGHRLPVTDAQTTMTAIVACVGVGVYATGIAVIANLLTSLSAYEDQYFRKIDQIRDYIRYTKMNRCIGDEILDYYRYMWKTNRTLSSSDNPMQGLNSELEDKVNIAINVSVMMKVPFLGDMGDSKIRRLVGRLRREVLLPEVFIFKAGDPGDAMHFIGSGRVAVLDAHNNVLAELTAGAFFGEMALLYGTRRNATVKTLDYTQVYTLTKNRFMEFGIEHPESMVEVLTMAERRLGTSAMSPVQKEFFATCFRKKKVIISPKAPLWKRGWLAFQKAKANNTLPAIQRKTITFVESITEIQPEEQTSVESFESSEMIEPATSSTLFLTPGSRELKASPDVTITEVLAVSSDES